MSADNWTMCPMCKAKVLASQYLKMLEAIDTRLDLDETLREDYELGTLSNGEFYVNYKCFCNVCGFKHSFKHEEQLPLSAGASK